MPSSDFQDRLARLHQAQQQRKIAPGTPPGGPAGNHRERLDRALAIAAAAGISRRDCFPPAMQALSALGLPIRPLHFKSLISLFLSGLCLGLCVFGGILWLFASDTMPVAPAGPIRGLVSLGWPGVAVLSLAIGAGFAAIIRAQAARAGLPRWRDL